ncbi:amino acid ABC transporter substrate-binding protein [Methanofollis aquaemaris]|uniref:Amino acid ABC transporter substrate-binding protein n=1 Tax=Methanofollis aquaemaris TaxID=126734 RepID=A0A8A3S6W2_9EURY|nr:ABC transporter substrate-binding protein [Methanofollis aquaemaris]QSZ67782.1 amino acid ABC transporter substrate-binding protein [Methanofollis aquaemaris]
MNMKLGGGLLVLILAFTVCFAGCTGSEAPADQGQETGGADDVPTYIVGVDSAYPPYAYMEKDGTITGLDVESVQWIAEKKGFKVEIKGMDWDGIIPALQQRKIDMVYSGMTITPERLEEVNFSNPYLTINQSFAVHDDSGLTMDDIMAGKAVIGAQRGTTGAYWVEQNLIANGTIPKENLKYFDSFPIAITALNNRQVDATIYDKPPHMNSIQGQPLHIVGEIYTGENYGVAIRKEDNKLLKTVNEGLDELMASPKWEELLKKYEML